MSRDCVTSTSSTNAWVGLQHARDHAGHESEQCAARSGDEEAEQPPHG
jgi:hypothetical protein